MTKFRKKPVVIDAVQFRGGPESAVEVIAFAGLPETSYVAFQSISASVGLIERVDIPTMEGTMSASVGDWIIRGVKGEFYPCKPDIFAATYEAAE